MTSRHKTVYKRGAEDGLYFGIYLSVMFLLSVFSLSQPLLSWVTILMALGVPVIIYRYLRRAYIEEYGTLTFSAMWLHGIVVFFCGSIISATVAFVYLRWIHPDFIYTTMQEVIKIYNEIGTSKATEIAATLQKMIDQNLLPTPILIAVQSVWSAVFTGSLLSMLISVLVPLKKIKQ